MGKKNRSLHPLPLFGRAQTSRCMSQTIGKELTEVWVNRVEKRRDQFLYTSAFGLRLYRHYRETFHF